jgi:probable phosphoglycerate mutase
MADDVWLVRHGETEWSRDGKHTSHTDLDLTEDGVEVAQRLRGRLSRTSFDLVLTSPLLRARRTAELAGFPDAQPEPDLVEWDYGDYEGLTTDEIRESVPGWTIWANGARGGETADAITRRLDRVIERLVDQPGRCLLFGHGHSLRALASRWLELPVSEGARLYLQTATVSVLGYERETRVLETWNAGES